jgi:hypothetical protein
MSITPTNQSKIQISPTGISRGATYLWGDTVATWGDSTATWGSAYVVSNITKSTTGNSLGVGSPIGLLLTLTYSSAQTFGGVTNISKN